LPSRSSWAEVRTGLRRRGVVSDGNGGGTAWGDGRAESGLGRGVEGVIQDLLVRGERKARAESVEGVARL